MSEPVRWQGEADRLAAAANADGTPTRWFEELYRAAADGEVTRPWPREEPHPALTGWFGEHSVDGSAQAVVVGCGMGADAEYLAALGLATTGFDISETALRLCRERYPASAVTYRQADLLQLAPDLVGAFDLVVEIYTVQAMSRSVRERAVSGVSSLVAPGGTLLVITFVLGHGADPEEGPPWPLTEAELRSFAGGDLRLSNLTGHGPEQLAEFHRPA
ncbi:class I SAM-dependent methyltransferase [Kineosporia rhizophila]|uniref:class I SAM-dependent methyltransferase n=1 Tax=Kineosporia rhizophila TaxID=84633 RepID=UPI001E2C6DC9|nr:class I SAM-dependent methyltransferase [Kineosporia rhizophila]MCE0537056.1 class I SAM-dependent methyltransferase [Kineosporia rhizophila]